MKHFAFLAALASLGQFAAADPTVTWSKTFSVEPSVATNRCAVLAEGGQLKYISGAGEVYSSTPTSAQIARFTAGTDIVTGTIIGTTNRIEVLGKWGQTYNNESYEGDVVYIDYTYFDANSEWPDLVIGHDNEYFDPAEGFWNYLNITLNLGRSTGEVGLQYATYDMGVSFFDTIGLTLSDGSLHVRGDGALVGYIGANAPKVAYAYGMATVVDYDGSNIRRISRQTGQLLGTLSHAKVDALAEAANGDIFVFAGDKLERYRSDFTLLFSSTITPLASIESVALDYFGNVIAQTHSGDTMTFTKFNSANGHLDWSCNYKPSPGQNLPAHKWKVVGNDIFVTTSASQATLARIGTDGSLIFDSNSVVGGGSTMATVQLSAPTPSGGLNLALGSSDASVHVPASAYIPAGSANVSFQVDTKSTTTQKVALITAYGGGKLIDSSLVIIPLLKSVAISPTSTYGGAAINASAILNAPATANTVVRLSTSTGYATVPVSTIVATGQTLGHFSIQTSTVAQSIIATISASLQGTTVSSTLTILPPKLKSLTLGTATLIGGASTLGTVTLNSPAPSQGIMVDLAPSGSITSPAQVRVFGGQTLGTFTVQSTAVTSNQSCSIRATLNSQSSQASVTVLAPVLVGLTLSPASVRGGANSAGIVRLSGPAPAGGTAITLTSGYSGYALVPSTVIVPAGSTAASFIIKTSRTSVPHQVLIKATLGSVVATAALAITP